MSNQSKELKDYLHLYKDCIVQVKRKIDKEYHIGRVCEITSKSNHGDWVKVWFDDVITVTSSTWEKSSSNSHTFFFTEDDIKPILRPLSDMTTEENFRWKLRGANSFQSLARTVKYFLDRHFDLFGLIDSGLAIDKATLK